MQLQSHNTEVLGLLAQMRSVTRDPRAIILLTDQMEVLVRSYNAPSIDDTVPGVHFTKCEGRIMRRLLQSKGRAVSRDQLMDAMYFDAGSEPHARCIAVLICRLRAKIKDKPLEIQALWGQGYKIMEIN